MRDIIEAGRKLAAEVTHTRDLYGASFDRLANLARALKSAHDVESWNNLPMLPKTMGQLSNGTGFRILAAANNRENDSWSTVVVVQFEGLLPHDDGIVDEPSILRQITEWTGYHWASEGNGGPGQPFARAPWVQLFGNIMIVTQHGGLDV